MDDDPGPDTADDATHLGDGAYATFDGEHVWLWAERGQGCWHRVALDEDALPALVRYARRHGMVP